MKDFAFFRKKREEHTAAWKNDKFSLTFFSWNQLFSIFFSKSVAFTKFLSFFHNMEHTKIKIDFSWFHLFPKTLNFRETARNSICTFNSIPVLLNFTEILAIYYFDDHHFNINANFYFFISNGWIREECNIHTNKKKKKRRRKCYMQ